MRSAFAYVAASVLTAFFLILTLPAFGQQWVSWIAFVPLLLAILKYPSMGRATLAGFIASLAHWSVGVHTVINAYGWQMFLTMILFAAIPVAVLSCAFFVAVRCTLHASRATQLIIHWLTPGITWMVLMAIFKLTPVDTLPLEVMFYQGLPLLQLSAFSEMFLLAFLILTCNAALTIIITDRSKQSMILGILTLLMVIGSWHWGYKRLDHAPLETGNIPIALIQSNFPMSMEWREENENLIVESYRQWAREADASNPAIIFFPEYNLSQILSQAETEELFSGIAKDTDTYVMTGTYSDLIQTGSGAGGQYNIGLIFSPTGEKVLEYRTGMNLPFRDIGELFDGSSYTPVDTPAGSAGLMVCYDDTARWVAHRWADAGADYLVILTNPSTFAGPNIRGFQLIQDQLRAIETGMQVVRLTATGESAVIDAYGRILTQTNYGEQMILHGALDGSH